MYYWGLVYRSFDEVRWKIVVDDVKGGGDHLKGVQLSPLNELSFELSGGSNGKVVVELSGSSGSVVVVGGVTGVVCCWSFRR